MREESTDASNEHTAKRYHNTIRSVVRYQNSDTVVQNLLIEIHN